jgi:hypothetical protein
LSKNCIVSSLFPEGNDSCGAQSDATGRFEVDAAA